MLIQLLIQTDTVIQLTLWTVTTTVKLFQTLDTIMTAINHLIDSVLQVITGIIPVIKKDENIIPHPRWGMIQLPN